MQYTTDELAIRLWDTEHVRHTMNRMCYYISNEDFRGCLNDLWTTQHKRTASLGYNNGFYVGMDAIVQHWVLDRAAAAPTANGAARMGKNSTAEKTKIPLAYSDYLHYFYIGLNLLFF